MSARELLHTAWARLGALLGRNRLERDLDEEMRFHLGEREARYREDGLTQGQAADAARRRFGNLGALKEACRDSWTFAPLETLAQDARFAARMLVRSPGFTAVAVLSLALGIGANAAMFSLVHAVLLRPLPYPDAERLVRVTGFYPKGAVAALQERSRALEVAGLGSGQAMNLTGQGEAARLVGSAVSANLFSVLGRGAALGRVFEVGEDVPGRDRVVILGHALWQSRFGGDVQAIGRTIALDGVERRVVGVMPAAFQFPSPSVQLWVPLSLDSRLTEDYWGFGWMPLVARLRPGASLAQARGELAALIPEIGGLFPWPAPGWNANATVLSLQEDLVGDVRLKLLVLQAAVGIVLLIACANVASLLLARSAVRRKEMALRAALGAGRGRILRQLLTESLVLSLAGGALGVLLAFAFLGGLLALLPADARGIGAVELDGRALAFATGLSLLCGLVFGTAPAASGSKVELAGAASSGGARGGVRAGARLRGSFVTAEVALAVVLAVGAGLLLRTLRSLTRVDPGFRAEDTLSVRVSPNAVVCHTRPSCIALYDEVLRRARQTTGLGAIAAASTAPLGAEQPLLPVELSGHPFVASEGPPPLLWAGAVTPSYFGTLGIPVLRGRGFTDGDGEEAGAVVLVSAATARRYWPQDDPVGQRIRIVWEERWRTVVGVVGDVRQYALSGRVPAEISGALYMPYAQAVGLDRGIPREMTLFARGTGPISADALVRLREAVQSVNPDVPVGEVRVLEEARATSTAPPRSMTWLFGAFAGAALLLAAIGTYGLVSYAAASRRYEIGVRMAVGATPAQIFGLVVGEGLRLSLLGLALGALLALAFGRALATFLYEVSAFDPATFAVVAGLLIATAVAASALPGRRAAATDPVRALRVD